MPAQDRSSGRSTAEQGFSAPQLYLPRGGGVIRGIGEQFAVNRRHRHRLADCAGRPPPTGRSGFSPRPASPRRTEESTHTAWEAVIPMPLRAAAITWCFC
jgi:hypothetical protein